MINLAKSIKVESANEPTIAHEPTILLLVYTLEIRLNTCRQKYAHCSTVSPPASLGKFSYPLIGKKFLNYGVFIK